jgi:hypothetical protein
MLPHPRWSQTRCAKCCCPKSKSIIIYIACFLSINLSLPLIYTYYLLLWRTMQPCVYSLLILLFLRNSSFGRYKDIACLQRYLNESQTLHAMATPSLQFLNKSHTFNFRTAFLLSEEY